MATTVARGSAVNSSVKQPQGKTSLRSSVKTIPEEPIVITPPPMTPGGIQRTGRSNSDKCRTQKKLCFREPEVISHSTSSLHKIEGNVGEGTGTVVVGGPLSPKSSMKSASESKITVEDMDALENQAMMIAQSIGQAFEVCNKPVGVAGEDDDSELQESANLSSQLNESVMVSGESKSVEPAVITSGKTLEPSNRSNSTLTQDAKVGSSSSSGTPPVGTLASSLTASSPIGANNGMVPEQGSHLEQKVSMMKPKPMNLDLSRWDNFYGDAVGLTTPGSSAVPTPTQPQSFFKEPNERFGVALGGINGKPDKENLAQAHEAQLLKEQLDQQTQNTRAALAQIQLLRDQLAAESAARIEAQTRSHQLLIHNKELLDHLQTLVRHIQELESGSGGAPRDHKSTGFMAAATAVTQPQVYNTSKTSSSGQHSPSTVPISFPEIESLRRQNAALLETLIYENSARSSFFGTIPHHAATALQAYPYGYPQLPPPQAPHLMYPFGNAASNSLIVTNNNNQPQSSSTSHSRGALGGDTYSNEMLATVFTSAGQPVLRNDASPFIQPLESEGSSGVLKSYLSPPPFGPVPKLGQIGRNASADCDQATGMDLLDLRRNVLGRSVSEKIGHRSELMSQVQRTQWARHTTN